MKCWNLLICCSRIFFENVFLQAAFKVDFLVFEQGKAVIERIGHVDIVSHYLRLDSVFFPTFSSPNSLTQVLACKMWAGGVIFAPFSSFLRIGGIEDDVCELGNVHSSACRP